MQLDAPNHVTISFALPRLDGHGYDMHADVAPEHCTARLVALRVWVPPRSMAEDGSRGAMVSRRSEPLVYVRRDDGRQVVTIPSTASHNGIERLAVGGWQAHGRAWNRIKAQHMPSASAALGAAS